MPHIYLAIADHYLVMHYSSLAMCNNYLATADHYLVMHHSTLVMHDSSLVLHHYSLVPHCSYLVQYRGYLVMSHNYLAVVRCYLPPDVPYLVYRPTHHGMQQAEYLYLTKLPSYPMTLHGLQNIARALTSVAHGHNGVDGPTPLLYYCLL